MTTTSKSLVELRCFRTAILCLLLIAIAFNGLNLFLMPPQRMAFYLILNIALGVLSFRPASKLCNGTVGVLTSIAFIWVAPLGILALAVIYFQSRSLVGQAKRSLAPATGDGARIVAIRAAWHIAEAEDGKVFARATLTGEQGKPGWKTWHGELRTPLISVTWGDGNQSDDPATVSNE